MGVKFKKRLAGTNSAFTRPGKNSKTGSQATMTQAKAHISLTTSLARLPAEGQSWIKGLNQSYRESTERVLNIVGADNFVRDWKIHRDDQINLENDFG